LLAKRPTYSAESTLQRRVGAPTWEGNPIGIGTRSFRATGPLLVVGPVVVLLLGSVSVLPSASGRTPLHKPGGGNLHAAQTPPSYCGVYTASLSVRSPNPASGPPGTHVTLVGSGFYGLGQAGWIEFWLSDASGADLSTLGYVPSGTPEPFNVTFDLPGAGVNGRLALGTYQIWALNSSTPANCANAQFTLTATDAGLACESYAPVLNVTSPIPAVGAAGTSVTLQGVGFYDLNLTYLYWASADGLGLTYLANVSTGATGGWFNFTVVVPAGFAPGTYVFWAFDGTTPPYDCAAVEFNLTSAGPTITLAPATGAGGTAVTVNGTGFDVSDTSVTITGAVLLFPLPCTLSGGSITGSCFFQVDGGVAGSHTISGVGNVGGGPGDTGTATFTLLPSLILNSSSGPVGSSFTISGIDFSAFPAAVDVSFDGRLLTPTGGTNCGRGSSATLITPDALGSFVCAFTVPSWATAGPNTVQGDDTNTTELTAVDTFTVPRPALSISPTAGPAYLTVTATGTGFAAATAITFSIDGGAVASPSTCLTDNTGSFPGTSGTACTFLVPAGLPAGDSGGQNVVATGTSAETASATFTLTIPTVVGVSSTTGAPGPTTFSLSGLVPSTVYDVYLDSTQGVASDPPSYFLGACTSSASGALTDCTVTIPSGLTAGTYYLDVFQDPSPPPYILSVFHFTVTSAPPKAAQSPGSGLPILDLEIVGVVVAFVAIAAAVVIWRRRGNTPPRPPVPSSEPENRDPTRPS
jgi:hypothetical protein